MPSKHKQQPSIRLLATLLAFIGFISAPDTCKPNEYQQQHVDAAAAPRTYSNRWAESHGICGNSLFPNDSLLSSTLRGEQAIGGVRTENQYQQALRDRLSKELLLVRVNIFYDASMGRQFADYGKLERFVRNLIYQTQLIYEQAEISTYFKVNFIVVKLSQSKTIFIPEQGVDEVIGGFARGPDSQEFANADLNLLLTFRSLHKMDKDRMIKILGVSYVGTFCRKGEGKVLVLTAQSISFAPILAHEFGHSFGSHHDGQFRDYPCDPSAFIMAPSHGPEIIKWSWCTVENVMLQFLYDINVSQCLFDPKRIENARPISEYFDFRNKENRKKLPGIEFSIDDQCKLGLGDSASSSLTRRYYDTCQDLVCTIGGQPVSLGQAPTGSTCRNGSCVNGSCIASQ